MTKDEALKLALEALEEYVNVVVSVNDPNEWTPKVADAGEPARKAITAIKEALAQPEQKSVAMADYMALTEKYVALKAAQRTWVGLTKEEFIYFSSYCHSEVVDEIEKLLQRKNT